MGVNIEVWSPIKGTNYNYHVSNLGRVYSSISDKVIVQHTGAGGYKGVILVIRNKCKKFLVHRLVAAVFCDNPKKLSDVHHINANKNDNRQCNLQWMSHRDNILEHFLRTKSTHGGLEFLKVSYLVENSSNLI